MADRSPKEPLRIWVPGCASGEEAYSIAICLLEFLGERSTSTPIQIFGTDVSEAGIDKARAGTYLDRGDVSVERLKRFFVKLDGHYQIERSVRDLCVFARHDVTRDPPFSQLDLVSCRNLLIYLDQALQRRVIPLFHYALKPQGFLVLGPAETIGQSSDLFELVDRPHRIYRKLAVPRHLGLELVAGVVAGEPQVPPGPRERAIQVAPVPVDMDRWQRAAERFLLARYAPACVVIDDGLKVLYFHGQTSSYLEHAGGAASLNLQKLARPGLLVELVPAIEGARSGGAPVQINLGGIE